MSENLTLIEKFKKINAAWPKKSIKCSKGDLSRHELFELAYLACSDVPYRCFSIQLNPANDHLKNVALLYDSSNKKFHSILTTQEDVVITSFHAEESELEGELNEIQKTLETYKEQLLGKEEDIRLQIENCILVLRKVDEAMHLSLSKARNRRVYFAIGECREQAALIHIFQYSNGADLVQLALHKWMDFALRLPQDEQFPEQNIVSLVKNFLQIKKWLKDLIINNLKGVNTLREEIGIE